MLPLLMGASAIPGVIEGIVGAVGAVKDVVQSFTEPVMKLLFPQPKESPPESPPQAPPQQNSPY
ncbi:hypothetical protein [Piscinibacter sp.]|uniref:hypothetical protein n=1 Tax=Piscinibacter sp. TaxID=1903157 RepID=UPI002C2486B2|nr:hypothetical protein [Albitalea sp.]HUG24828.1 hypothetical protein [Albitalea sp.]